MGVRPWYVVLRRDHDAVVDLVPSAKSTNHRHKIRTDA